MSDGDDGSRSWRSGGDVPPREVARVAGRRAVRAARRKWTTKLLEQLRQDPELLANLSELGLVRREWVEHGGKGPITTTAPAEVLERALERSVERKPSLLAQLGLTAIQVLSSPPEADGDESRTVERLAVAFTDLEGFTEYTAREGDEAASAMLASHHRTVGPIIRSRGGRLVKRLGDGLLLTFPEPEAAVLACLELIAAEPAPLRLRAGINVGSVVVLRDDVIGHVVNVAARVAEAAGGGEVLATAEVCSTVGTLPGARFGATQAIVLKGVEGPVPVCEVWPAGAPAPGHA
ncbi:MAG TPA: adenylate/guanylate cyclase domain-containing protein [Acidimicrobiales bacterium]|nr:adenylate/guanylate cyclase domain-containing protein [Acidimicrobiales bacterium]